MKCDYGEQISMLIDGELSAAASEKITTHLIECEDCRALERDFLFFRREIQKPAAELGLVSSAASIKVSEKQKESRLKLLFPAPAIALMALICVGLGIWYFAFYPNKNKQISSERESRAVPETGYSNDSSLARFDKGGRAEIYIAPRETNENQ